MHLGLIAQQLFEVGCCSQDAGEHYVHIYGCWMDLHWKEELYSTGTHVRLI